MKRILFQTVVVGLLILIAGQVKVTGQFFRSLTTAQGLSHQVVTCIYQDSQGFIWIGTQDGLNRYDGYEFMLFSHDQENERSLAGNYIRCILEDHQGGLWIGTEENGLSRFDRNTLTFQNYRQAPESLSDNHIKCLFLKGTDSLLIGTQKGIDLLNTTTHRISPIPMPDQSVHSINTLLAGKDGFLWMGTDQGLLRLSDRGTQLQSFRNDPEDPLTLSNNEVHCLFEDIDGELLIGTNQGINRFDPVSGKFQHHRIGSQSIEFLAGSEIYAIVSDSTGSVWIGTFGNGLVQVNKGAGTSAVFRSDPANRLTPGSDYLLTLFTDRSGMLWAGTYGAGISLLERQVMPFHTIRAGSHRIPSNEIYAIYQTSAGSLWIGTDAGIGVMDPDTGLSAVIVHDDRDPSSLGNDIVYAITSDKEGNIWIGTAAGGISLLSAENAGKGTYRFRYIRPVAGDSESLFSDEIFCLLPDPDGTVWAGTAGGLQNIGLDGRILSGYRNDPSDPASLAGNAVYCLHYDRKGILWIGTGNGLNALDRETGEMKRIILKEKTGERPFQASLFTLYMDDQDQLWIGTDNQGLYCYTPESGEFRHYGTSDGLPDNVIYSLLEDQDKNLWFSTNNGLGKGIKHTGTHKLTFVIFNKDNYLESNVFNIGSCYISPSGRMYMGGSDGVTWFDPDRVRGNTFIPPVFLTGLQLFYEPVALSPEGKTPLRSPLSETSEIRLRHNQNVLTLKFAALNYCQPEKNRYAWKMEGFDNDWNFPASNTREVTYTNLAPGTYTFRVKASNNSGNWNENGTSLRIVIRPPFTRTVWFFLLVALALLILVVLITRIRTRQLEKTKRYLEKEVEKRTAQLIDSEKMASLGQLTAGIAHEINNPINFVSGNVAPLNRDIGDIMSLLAAYDEIVKKHQLENKFSEVEKRKKEIEFQYMVDEIGHLLKGIEEGAQRTSEIVRSLRHFSRLDELDFKAADIHEGLDSTLLILRNKLKDSIRIEKEYSRIPRIHCYPGQLNQVFMNILTNAIQAIEGEGVIRISTAVEGPQVVIRIQDSGRGMSEEVKKRIFEPFFTTKEVGQGTGLGLSISYGIIEKHHGTIQVESEPGKGSEFTIRLPIQQQEM